MSNFDKAIELVLKHEGGLVDHPNDPGGITNFGISARWAKRANVEIDIASLTREGAIQLYKKYFWDMYPMEKIEYERVATKLFDTLVNVGPSQAFKCLQRALRSCGGYPYVKDDGVLGPITLNTLNLVLPENILQAFRSEQAGFYRLLVAVDSTKFVFLKGWLRRAYDEV